MKHLVHSRARGRSPIINPCWATVIENRITFKESREVCNTSHIPASKILIKWVSPIKHPSYTRYLTCIPVTNRLIKACAITKHLRHIRHRACIPSANTWRASVIKSHAHVIVTIKQSVRSSDIAYIPIADILIKTGWLEKHATYICSVTRIPSAHITLITKKRTTPKHFKCSICQSKWISSSKF